MVIGCDRYVCVCVWARERMCVCGRARAHVCVHDFLGANRWIRKSITFKDNFQGFLNLFFSSFNGKIAVSNKTEGVFL